jgi:hypothetical protein
MLVLIMQLNVNRAIIGYPRISLTYSHDRITCNGCALNPANTFAPIYPYHAYSIHKILTHLTTHREHGDIVPEKIEQELFNQEYDIFPEGGSNKGIFIIPTELDKQLLNNYGTTH